MSEERGINWFLADAEMQVARGRLRGFLNEIMEPEASSSSAAVVAPAKVAMRGRPKRQRRESSGTGNKPSLIKLFDRLVNVSQYDENSPLYPICREWFYNRKTESVKETSTGDANPTYYTGREPLLKQLQKGRIDRVAALPPPNDLEVPKIPFCEPPSMGNGLDLFTTDYVSDGGGSDYYDCDNMIDLHFLF